MYLYTFDMSKIGKISLDSDNTSLKFTIYEGNYTDDIKDIIYNLDNKNIRFKLVIDNGGIRYFDSYAIYTKSGDWIEFSIPAVGATYDVSNASIYHLYALFG